MICPAGMNTALYKLGVMPSISVYESVLVLLLSNAYLGALCVSKKTSLSMPFAPLATACRS